MSPVNSTTDLMLISSSDCPLTPPLNLKTKLQLLIFVVVGLLSTIVNFCAVKSARKGAPSGYTQFNTVMSTASVTAYTAATALKELKIIQLKTLFECAFWSFLGRVMISVVSLTVLEIFLEAIWMNKRGLSRPEQGTVPKCCSLMEKGKKTLFWYVWITAIVISLPSFITHEIVQGPCEIRCKKGYFFGSYYVHIVYEVLFFLVISFSPPIYMSFVLYNMKLSLTHLHLLQPIPLSIRHKIRRIRLVFCHLIFFIIIWIPLGIFAIFFKCKEPGSHISMTHQFSDQDNWPPGFWIPSFILMLYLVLQPWFSIYTYFGISRDKLVKLFCPCVKLVFQVRETRPTTPPDVSVSVVPLETF